MGYRRIDIEERRAIARLRQEGRSIPEIAADLDRSPPTASREINRNSVARANTSRGDDEKARARRRQGSRLDRDDPLRDYDWRNFLPKRKATRGLRPRKGRGSVAFIRERRPLSERPAGVSDRVEFGRWEADTMLFGVKKQALLILHEQASRLTLVQRPENKGAEAMARAMVAVTGTLPVEMRRSVTFVNGTDRTPR